VTWQAVALIPGILGSGITMVAGTPMRTPVRLPSYSLLRFIAAAGLLKLPELVGNAEDGVREQAFVGAIAAALTTYLAVKFLLRFLQSNRLIPFAFAL
jgi:undecaprenyl-diphosphatase